MTKTTIAIAFSLAMAGSVCADDFKLLFVNSGTINIGGKDRTVGEVVADNAAINWSSDKQAIKVQNVSNKNIKVISAVQQKKLGFKSIFDFMTKTGHLSTRGDGLMGVEGLEEYLSNTFYLLDEEKVESMLETTGSAYFQVEFTVNGKSYTKKLKGDAKSFTLDAATFNVAGAEGKEIPVKISYCDEEGAEVITDKMKVVVLAKSVK